MANVNVRGLSDESREALKVRAATAGMSLEAYARRALTKSAMGIGLGQKPLLLGYAEAASGTLLEARVGDNFVGIRHLFTPQAP